MNFARQMCDFFYICNEMEFTTDNDSSGIFTSSFLSQQNDRFCNYIKLGENGFNETYKAQRFGKWYFLKTLKPDYSTKSQYIDLLAKEFDLTIQLDHPNIVRTISKEHDETLGDVIVLEYIDGITLTEFKRQKHPTSVFVKIVNELLDALAYVHAKQIVHRDLKPDNILITNNGNNVKIIDFGLADADYYSSLKLSSGTLKYIAPEQLNAPETVDCRADIYSLGIILSELKLPRAYSKIWKKCTQADRERRYNSIADIQHKIKIVPIRRFLWNVLFLGIILISTMLFYRYFYSSDKNIVHENSQTDTIHNYIAVEDSISENNNVVEKTTQPVKTQKTSTKKMNLDSVKKMDLDSAKKMVDNFYAPLLDSLANHKFSTQQKAFKSYSALINHLTVDLWLPIKEAWQFKSEREELTTWQELVPYIGQKDQILVDFVKELPDSDIVGN